MVKDVVVGRCWNICSGLKISTMANICLHCLSLKVIFLFFSEYGTVNRSVADFLVFACLLYDVTYYIDCDLGQSLFAGTRKCVLHFVFAI